MNYFTDPRVVEALHQVGLRIKELDAVTEIVYLDAELHNLTGEKNPQE